MSEQQSSLARISEKVAIAVLGTVLSAAVLGLAALIWRPVRNWLLGNLVVPNWCIAAAVIVAAVAVLVAARRRPEPPLAARPTAPEMDAPLQFAPTALQERCVAILRNFDDEWVPMKDFEGIITDHPRADIRQALDGLVSNGWAKDRMSATQGFSYCLHGPGLDYARMRDFPTRQNSRSP